MSGTLCLADRLSNLLAAQFDCFLAEPDPQPGSWPSLNALMKALRWALSEMFVRRMWIRLA